MCRKICFLFVAVMAGAASPAYGEQEMDLEQSVCGLKEPIIFWLWSMQAGSPDAARLRGVSNAEDISFTTKDGRILRGYRLRATGAGAQQSRRPEGYLLVMQGNAILADQILREFIPYAEAGYDVYIYDYRGYGRSAGKRRLKAIISDYKEIITSLNSVYDGKRLVYAMSFGGIVLLDAFEPHFKPDRLIIDSTPSRLSDYGCPPEYDPINHLPPDCGNFMFIVGLQDRVVPAAMSRDMVEKAQARGASVLQVAEFAHPFMDRDLSVHRQRMNRIRGFLLGHE